MAKLKKNSPPNHGAGVRVTIHDEQGKLLEVGDASQVRKDWWTYIPTGSQVKGQRTTVSVWDLPGNRVQMELEQ